MLSDYNKTGTTAMLTETMTGLPEQRTECQVPTGCQTYSGILKCSVALVQWSLFIRLLASV